MSDFVIENGVLTKYTGPGEDVVIPEGVTEIGAYVFSEYRNLQRITIPESVTAIGHWAFAWCRNLQSITLPEGVTTIGERAFYWCQNLVSVNIPENITAIGDHAFYRCRSLQSITIPEGVAAIDSSAFYWCDKLQRITFLGNVPQTIADAFKFVETAIIIAPDAATEVWKKAGLMFAAILGFLHERAKYTNPQIVAEYDQCLATQPKKVLQQFWKKDELTAVLYYAEKGMITPKNFEKDYLEPAQEAGAKECVAWLLNWKNENISPSGKKSDWKL